MKIETEKLEHHQVKLLVEVEPAELEQAKRKAARQIAKRIKVPGFRPGKAPYNVVERQVGENTILEDALEMLAQDIYPKALDEAGINPYGPGTLENIPTNDPPKFEFTVPLQAEVELGDYGTIRIPYDPPSVTDEDVDDALFDLQERHAVVEPVDHAAEEGDLVRIVLSGKRTEPEENQDPVLIKERTLPVIIESVDANTEHEWPFPGFSRKLIGHQKNDNYELQHTFSDESPYESLRGVAAEFNVRVEQVSLRTLPELDDEFALSVTEFETLDELKAELERELATNQLAEFNQEYDEKIIDQLLEDAIIKYPSQMIDRELDDMFLDLENRLAQQGLDIETYLKINQKSEDDLREEMRETAEARLRRSLAIFELAKLENIEVSQDEIQHETINTLNTLSQALPEDEMRKFTAEGQMQNLVSNIMADMLVRKTIQHIRNIASDGKAEKLQETSSPESDISPEAVAEDPGDAGNSEGEPELDGDNKSRQGLEEDLEDVVETESNQIVD